MDYFEFKVDCAAIILDSNRNCDKTTTAARGLGVLDAILRAQQSAGWNGWGWGGGKHVGRAIFLGLFLFQNWKREIKMECWEIQEKGKRNFCSWS